MVRFQRIRRRIATVRTFPSTSLIHFVLPKFYLSLANLSQTRMDTYTERSLLTTLEIKTNPHFPRNRLLLASRYGSKLLFLHRILDPFIRRRTEATKGNELTISKAFICICSNGNISVATSKWTKNTNNLGS